MNKVFRLSAFLSVSAVLAGCSIFAPYDSKFMCERARDYGSCQNVSEAYDSATGATKPGQMAFSHAKTGSPERSKDSADKEKGDRAIAAEPSSRNRYKEAEYAEMAKLLEQPVTPMLVPPKELRTLVVAYATGDKAVYMPRYIYYVVSEGHFVMGDYLNAPSKSTGMVRPNGGQ